MPAAPRLLVLVVVAALVAAIAFAGSATADEPGEIPSGSHSLFADSERPDSVQTFPDRTSVELGIRFSSQQPGSIIGIRFFRSTADGASHSGSLWSSTGSLLARLTFGAVAGPGWQYAAFDRPVTILPGSSYVASYHADGGYAAESEFFPASGRARGPLSTVGTSSAYAYGSSPVFPTKSYNRTNYWVDPVFRPAGPAPSPSPTSPSPSSPSPSSPSPSSPSPSAPSPSPTPSTSPGGGGYPDASNTGVPGGVSLTNYTGPMTITQAGTVIDAKSISGRLVIAAGNVTIKRSRINGSIDSDSGGASVTVADSEIDGGTAERPGIGFRNITVLRTEVTGGQHSILCGDNCRVEDSWLHSQYLPANDDWHTNAYLSNGGSNVTLIGNTFQCTTRDNSVGGGCTADVSFFGDFDAITDVTVDGNLFKGTPGGYCGTFGYNRGKPYGTAATRIKVVNNVFERGSGGKCGYWGPVTGFPVGNEWSNNRWIDGGTIGPSAG